MNQVCSPSDEIQTTFRLTVHSQLPNGHQVPMDVDHSDPSGPPVPQSVLGSSTSAQSRPSSDTPTAASLVAEGSVVADRPGSRSSAAPGGTEQAETSTRWRLGAKLPSPMSPEGSGSVIGRQEELAAISLFLDEVPSGPGALRLEGQPGIGKTTLWQHALVEATTKGFRVLACRPSESETKLSFSALGDLLGEVLDEVLPVLPAPQSKALEVALFLAEAAGPPPSQLAVSLAVRGALGLLAETGPVLVAIDDLQWLDGPSSEALDFALRRFARKPIGVLATTRRETPASRGWIEGAIPEGRLRRLNVLPLEPHELRALLRQRLDLAVPRSHLAQLHRTSGGNPFFALEIGRALQRRGTLPDPGEALPMPDSLTALLRTRLESVPGDVREVLLVVATLSDSTKAMVRRALDAPSDAETSLTEAVRAGLVEVDGERIRFTHPLLRSVLLESSPRHVTRSLHRKLAEIIDEPEERARHLALGSEGPDARVAAELEEASRLVRSRGASSAAAELCEQAGRLTPADHEEDRHRRVLRAAEFHLDAGATGRSRLLLEDLVADLPAGIDRAAALQRLGWVRYHEDSWTAAAGLFEQALGEAEGDAHLEVAIALDRSLASLLSGDLRAAQAHSESALAQAEHVGEPALLAQAMAMTGSVGFLMGNGVAAELMQRAVEMETWGRPRPTLEQPSVALGVLLKLADDLDGARTLLESTHRRALEEGNDRSLPFLLFHLAELECWAGNWPLAARHSEEGYRVAVQTGQEAGSSFSLYARALVDAHRGLLDQARDRAEEGLALASRAGAEPARILLLSVLGFIAVSAGDFAEAARRLRPLMEAALSVGVFEPGVLRYLGDGIEALVLLDDLDMASALTDQLEGRGAELGRTWALAVGARCRGLILSARGHQPGAIQALDEAIRHHERLSQPFELARTLLAHGVVLRRDRRKRAAREALEHALEVFESLGAPLWEDRARTELARIGGRAPSTLDLTPTEARVAELVAGGATNKEVATALFLSLKTVEWNLSRIYRKLGVRSRTGLARWLSSKGHFTP
jgi:ATP/maltotriose-dependent transcriptional regulator MalT